MKIDINEDKKRVEIWLTRAEANDSNVRDQLKPMYSKYKQNKYMVAVFISGTCDVAAQTAMLLKTNKNV